MTTSTATQYVIVMTSYFYGPSESRALVLDYRTGRAARFDSRAEARQHIDEYLTAGDRYYLAHNESGLPSYRIERIDRLPQYLTWEL